ncbi:sugar ABC transporter substrate-binding protein [Paenibacillus baekrokdamisoli]|uniref:Sugar ABC transporter substrate-binding protein n=1 Tax=Paenibacillus baekrokdamisoli TaxID=1712516 RepID=A0A3G9JHY7_9BACL|nr:extracellular solute-binding protein [Paenibacillus baekrokdamisoli]MBB3068842.1 multiple sugar transport system substrate-binding protein [Paenibacillus baekrokdamisoli]BBH23668.1 sugar ABC transporter substrate-binding protein [Paenibacillus baekrokdamisoli]
MKKGFVILLTAVLIFTLSACGGNKAANQEGSGKASEGKASEGAASKSAESLTLWHWKVAFDPGFKAVVDAFEKKTGIKVNTEVTTPDDAYKQKVTASATANNLPDIYAYWAGQAEGAFDGIAMEWTEELNRDSAWKSSFFPSALSGLTIAQSSLDTWVKDKAASDWKKARKVGEIYGIPLDVGAFYTVYGNAKLLADAGVPTDAPATIEEWVARMKKVKEATNTPGFVFSAKTFSVYENWMVNFLDYMKNGEESFTKFMNREEKMSDPQHIHVAQFIEDLTKSGLMIPGSVSLDIDPADQAFTQGKAAYLLGGTFTYASLTAMGMNPADIVSFRVPAYEGSKLPDAKVTPFPLVQMIVNSKSPNAKEAVEFVKFLTSDEGMTLYANGAYDIPSVKIQDKSKLNESINAMLSSLNTESTWWSENSAISSKVFGPEWQLFHEAKQKIILGSMTAKEAAAKFDEAAAAEKAKEQK